MKKCGIIKAQNGRFGNKSIDFWRDKRVFVTGHTGFKGSWLCLWLNRMGANVAGLSLPEPVSKPNLFDLLGLEKQVNDIRGNIINFDICHQSINKLKPEIIIHMAAQSLVSEGYANPVDTFHTNVMGTVNVLESCRRLTGTKTVLVVTSDKCYENKEEEKYFVEENRLGGLDPYSNSKACAELVTYSYKNSFKEDYNKIKISTVRAGNVIGGGDWSKNRIIPDCIKSFLNKEVINIRSPNSVRPWQHVLDPLFGYLTLIKQMHLSKESLSSSWNFGPKKDNQRTVLELVTLSSSIWPDNKGWQTVNESSFNESELLFLDSSKVKSKINFKPKWNFEISINKTIGWYKSVLLDKANAKEISMSQIEDYLSY